MSDINQQRIEALIEARLTSEEREILAQELAGIERLMTKLHQTERVGRLIEGWDVHL